MITMSNPERRTAFTLLEQCRDKGFPLVSISIETTGLDPQKNHIIQIGAVSYSVGEDFTLTETRRFNRYVACPDPVPGEATAINGITDATLLNAEDLSPILNKFRAFCGSSFVALMYNAPFALSFFGMAHVNTGISFTPAGVIDAYRIVAEILGFEKGSRALKDISMSFKVDVEGHDHDALHDAQCVAMILQQSYDRFAESIRNMPQGKEVPQILDIKKNGVLYEVYLRYYGKVILDPYAGTWTNEWGCFEKVSVDLLELEFLRLMQAASLRSLTD